MARDDGWFRNKTWNDEIAAVFYARLKRLRGNSFNKAQHLRIQAFYLTRSHPRAALELLEQYFPLGDIPFLGLGFCLKAQALTALGDLDGAVLAYESAVARDRAFAQRGVDSAIEYACFVVEHEIARLYQRALDLLPAGTDGGLVFPDTAFRAYGARAILLQRLGRHAEAVAAAKVAMTAAAKTESGLAKHPKLGLVAGLDTPFARSVRAIAEDSGGVASRLRGLVGRVAARVSTSPVPSTNPLGVDPDWYPPSGAPEEEAFLARMRNKEAERREARAKDRADEAPLRAELAAAGFPVETVRDLVQKRNGPTIADTDRFPFGRYEAAIPILLHWLPRLENQVVKDWVIRALSVPWAGPDVVAALALELRRPNLSDRNRFAAGDTLATILGKGDVDTLLDLAADDRNGRGRTMIVLRLASIRDPRIPPLLMRLLADETVAAQAITVLGKLQVVEARPLIEPFLTHGNAFIRTEARKAIARIDRPKRVRSRPSQ